MDAQTDGLTAALLQLLVTAKNMGSGGWSKFAKTISYESSRPFQAVISIFRFSTLKTPPKFLT